MNQCRPCGCKGKRSCLICEEKYNIIPSAFVSDDNKEKGYIFCYKCEKAWPGWDCHPEKTCPNHEGLGLSISGVYVLPNFITEEEKDKLLAGMSKEKWELSQSGRRKQNYGPKCNFKKNKIQLGDFHGFPIFSKFVQDKFKSLSILKDFFVIEQCSLEYDPKKGASIDPHIDDCWIWGERIVTVNVLGDTFLTLSKYKGATTKYNLNHVKSYPRVVDENGCFLGASSRKPFCINENSQENIKNSDITLRIFMPEKSLIVLYGSARYEWEHYVLREDVKNLRICLAYREFTPPYLKGGDKQNVIGEILQKSEKFW